MINKCYAYFFKISLLIAFVVGLYLFSGFVNSNLGYYNVFPVVTYHHIVENQEDCINEVIVTAKEFEEHLAAFVREGYTTVFLDDLYEMLRLRKRFDKKYLAITFDDGYRSNYIYAYPLLKKYGLCANISVVSTYIGEDESPIPMLSWDDILDMEDSGFVRFYNHGYVHIDYSKVPINEMVTSIDTAEQILSGNLKKHYNKIFVSPFGGFDRHVERALEKNGFVMQITTKRDIVKVDTSLKRIPRINIGPGLSGDDVIKKIEGMY